MAQLACGAAGADEAAIEVVDPPPGPAPKLPALDVAPLLALGWRPQIALEEGLSVTYDWLASGAA